MTPREKKKLEKVANNIRRAAIGMTMFALRIDRWTAAGVIPKAMWKMYNSADNRLKDASADLERILEDL